MERDRMNLSLSTEAIEIVNKRTTERKRGEWISKAIVTYAQVTEAYAPTGEDEKLGVLERVEAKLDRLLTLFAASSQVHA